LGHAPRRPQATPNAKRFLQRNGLLIGARLARTGARSRDLSLAFGHGTLSYVAGLVGVRGLRLVLNTAVAVLVLSLPFAATAASRANTDLGQTLAVASVSTTTDASRAQPIARGGAIAASRNPVTANAEDARPIQKVTVHEGDTLATMANYYDVSVEAIAFANAITDASSLQIGQTLVIPPAEGALYTVADGDTVESVAARFKVDPSVIMSYNRLYFEPEHFAAGQLIFVRGAQLPSLKEPTRVVTGILAGPPVDTSARPRTGTLSWPVGGVITQYFWWGHTGTDIAAPYGTGIGASADGVVSATGWVAVGGLRVCVQHAGDLQTCYYHTSAVYVSVGQQVTRGQIIAAIGLTGVTTGPHVHWECKLGSQFVDCLSL
jgi:murein DD-endopeptidase MepM/ murein hydrolase activator NlpD